MARAWNPAGAARMGAFYLDAVKPDWFRCVKLTLLDLASARSCVLGQCFTGYFDALKQLVPEYNGYNPSLHEEYANRYAFAVRFGFQVPDSHQERGGYERLGLAWKALIRQRRKNRRRVA